MTVALALALFLAPPGFAQDPDEGNRTLAESGPAPVSEPPWKVEPYWEPLSELRVLVLPNAHQVAGIPVTVQIIGGVSGGLRYRYRDTPHWYGYTRAAGSLTYGFLFNGVGLDGRVGSFFGFDDDLFRVTTGPDFFANMYQGSEYTLRFSTGIAWDIRGTVKPTRDLWVTASIRPAWLMNSQRRGADVIGIADEMEATLSVFYFGQFHLQAGWMVWWNVVGFLHGPVFSVRM
jgi:hypothetical protein